VESFDADQEMKDYYAERAPVYDRVYSYPERQSDLRTLETLISHRFGGKRVLEIAAGTGYWTQFISNGAISILAIDATKEALDQIEKRHTKCPVTTQVADAYALKNIPANFDAAFAALWFSHIPIERRQEWFDSLHQHLRPGSSVFIMDNSDAQCDRLPLSYSDDQGNTYQTRQTDSGETYEVLKNFPKDTELFKLLRTCATDLEFENMDNFWWCAYRLKRIQSD